MPCSVYKLLHCRPKHEEGPYLDGSAYLRVAMMVEERAREAAE